MPARAERLRQSPERRAFAEGNADAVPDLCRKRHAEVWEDRINLLVQLEPRTGAALAHIARRHVPRLAAPPARSADAAGEEAGAGREDRDAAG